MARAFIGNFKGPKGDKGETGPQGKQGNTGATGRRGSRWTEGTAITGTSTTATVFSGTGIADALVNDMYLNTSTSNVYRCTVGGAAIVAKWVFVGCIKGAKGDKGDRGATGATGTQGPRGAKGATGPQGPSGTADTTFTEASALTKLTSGEPFKTMLGKLAKAVSSVFDKLDKSKVVNNQTTTVEGFALDARQANPNIDGTLAKQVADLNGSLEHINRFSTIFRLFANVPLLNGIHVFFVTGDGNPVTDSPYPDVDGWWNVICFGIVGVTRMTQITSQVFKRELGYKGKDELWIRSMHDDSWSEWVKL